MAGDDREDDATEVGDDGLGGEVGAFQARTHHVHRRGVDHHCGESVAAPEQHDAQDDMPCCGMQPGKHDKVEAGDEGEQGEQTARAPPAEHINELAADESGNAGGRRSDDAAEQSDVFHRVAEVDHPRTHHRKHADESRVVEQ